MFEPLLFVFQLRIRYSNPLKKQWCRSRIYETTVWTGEYPNFLKKHRYFGRLFDSLAPPEVP
jgi:hypothetical protein